MLDILSSGFEKATNRLKGKAVLNEDNIKEAIEDIRISLLEADVEYGVVKSFISRVKEKALGEIVELKAGRGQKKLKVNPSDHFIKICGKELENLMGPADASLHLPKNKPAIIMMIGLQGSGKTTTTGKLTKYLIEKFHRRPLLVAADTYRAAAIEQLKVIGKKIGVPVFYDDQNTPVEICKNAIQHAGETDRDVILFDTAGRLTIDEALMEELSEIKAKTSPDNIILVCDSMMGQDAVTTANDFNNKLDITGVIITKLDGDARGGAALSIKEVTGKPIKFLGIGESLENLEEFRPEGLASRILGMGDIVGLMKDFEKVAAEDQEEQAMKMLRGSFTYDDFYQQIQTLQKMGPLKDVAAKLPIKGMIPKDANIDDKELIKTKSIIDSMTKQEKIKPGILNPSRVKRIAQGSGRTINDVNQLIQQFSQMRKMMGMLGKNMGLLGKIPGVGGLSQINQMRKMAKSMGLGAGGFDEHAGDWEPSRPTKSRKDREKQKKLRKAARKSRKKNRK